MTKLAAFGLDGTIGETIFLFYTVEEMTKYFLD